MDYTMLRRAVTEALKVGVERVRAKRPGETLKGICVCTDDNTETVFAMATFGVAREFEFSPGEWEEDLGRDIFKPARMMLTARSDAGGDGPAEWKATFATFVGALNDARRQGALGDTSEMVLMVASTDPSREMAELGFDSVRELSAPAVYERLQVLLGRAGKPRKPAAKKKPAAKRQPAAKKQPAKKPTGKKR